MSAAELSHAADPAIAFLRDLALVLGSAAITSVLFRILKLPVALGYVLAGMLVGPYLPTGIDANPSTIATLTELGVTLLLFSVGLELSFSKLRQVGGSAMITALVEVSLVVLLGYGFARALDISVRESLLVGAALGISSTMLVAKTLDTAADPKLRQFVLGVLVVEDLLAILLLALLTPVALHGGVSAAQIGRTALQLLLFLAVLLVLGYLLVPRATRYVARMQSPETLLVASVGFCFCVAMAAVWAGFSVALGAFVAGVLVAESGEGHRVEHLVSPLKDLFAAIFLVAVGMQIDPLKAAEQPFLALGLCVVVLVGKVIGGSLGSLFTGQSLTMAMRTGLSLAQIGEFSFIIAALGARVGNFGATFYSAVVATSVATALVTSLLMPFTPPFLRWLEGRLPDALRTWLTFYGSWIEHLRKSQSKDTGVVRRYVRNLVVDTIALSLLAISAGLGRNTVLNWLLGHGFGLVLAVTLYAAVAFAAAAPFVLGLVRSARRLGGELAMRVLPVPDTNRVDLAASPRRIFIVTLQLVIVVLVALPLMAITQPFLPSGMTASLLVITASVLGVSFWRSAMNFQGHVQAGAQVLVEVLVKQARQREHAPRLMDDEAQTNPAIERAQSVLPGFSNLTTLTLAPNTFAVGQSLRSLNLRGATGATVLAIRRGGTGLVPSAEDVLRVGDELVLTGSEEAVRAARALVERSGATPNDAALTLDS